MSKEKFIERKFSAGSIEIIDHANRIIRKYQADGFTLTLRQLYYQFVSRDLLPNKQSEYKRLGSIINDGRLAGLIDWEAIEDRTRNLRKDPSWTSPEEIISAVADQYREDLWRNQPHMVEVWIEKDALVGVIEPVCERFRVPYFACRGYSSQSEQWRAGRRFAAADARGQSPIILHLGDHDPSGIDMTRDNRDRLSMFAYGDVEVRRLALNFDQVEEYNPPPNPAKESDSRAESYIEEFGAKSWELDALEPRVIDELISDALEDIIEPEAWEKCEEQEEQRREFLRIASSNWSQVEEFLGKLE